MQIATDVKCDEPIEVSEKQYTLAHNYYCGLIARRKHENKFFIKIWVMSYAKEIIKFLNTIK